MTLPGALFRFDLQFFRQQTEQMTHIGTNTTKAKQAMTKLVDKNMVDEVVGISGTKYYLTQIGKDYCRSKSR